MEEFIYSLSLAKFIVIGAFGPIFIDCISEYLTREYIQRTTLQLLFQQLHVASDAGTCVADYSFLTELWLW